MGHKSYSRISRVNRLIQEIIADEIEGMDDENLELVSVTGCDVSPDIRHAKVFISVLGDESKREEAIKYLEKNRGRFKRAMSNSTHMKYIPDIHFLIDSSIDEGFHIEEIIHDIHSRGDSLSVRNDNLLEG